MHLRPEVVSHRKHCIPSCPPIISCSRMLIWLSSCCTILETINYHSISFGSAASPVVFVLLNGVLLPIFSPFFGQWKLKECAWGNTWSVLHSALQASDKWTNFLLHVIKNNNLNYNHVLSFLFSLTRNHERCTHFLWMCINIFIVNNGAQEEMAVSDPKTIVDALWTCWEEKP